MCIYLTVRTLISVGMKAKLLLSHSIIHSKNRLIVFIMFLHFYQIITTMVFFFYDLSDFQQKLVLKNVANFGIQNN